MKNINMKNINMKNINMKKYLPIIILILGGIANFLILTPLYIHYLQTIIGLLLGVIITILAVICYQKVQYTWQKVCLLLSVIISISPVLYFIFLVFAIG